jgi:hypothetical protein
MMAALTDSCTDTDCYRVRQYQQQMNYAVVIAAADILVVDVVVECSSNSSNRGAFLQPLVQQKCLHFDVHVECTHICKN